MLRVRLAELVGVRLPWLQQDVHHARIGVPFYDLDTVGSFLEAGCGCILSPHLEEIQPSRNVLEFSGSLRGHQELRCR